MANEKNGTLELIEWLKRLLAFAREQKMSARIQDSIEECIQEAEKEDADKSELRAAVEDILKSMEHKLMSTQEQSIVLAEDGTGNRITLEDIREKVRSMAARCRRETDASMQNMGILKVSVIEKAHHEMQEMAYCEAHIEELKHEGQYLNFYNSVKERYESEVFHMNQEWLNGMADNYEFMAEHIKSMLRSAGGRRGMENQRYYEEYAIVKSGIENAMETVAHNVDCGGSDIWEFGHRTAETVNKIVKKTESKKKFWIAIPVILLLLFLVGRFGIGIWEKQNELEQTRLEEESRQSDGVKQDEYQREWLEYGKYMYENNINELKDELKDVRANGRDVLDIMIQYNNIIWRIVAVLIILIIYSIYIRAIKKACNREICRRVSPYLQTENAQFVKDNVLQHKLDAAMQKLINEYERQYLNVLNSLYGGVTDEFAEMASSENSFVRLKEEWKTVKYNL